MIAPALIEPDTPREASERLAELGEDAVLVAGGTAVTLLLRERRIRPSFLVSLTHFDPDLRGIRYVEGDGVRIGGLTRIADVERDQAVARRFPALGRMAARLGNTPVRNMVTVGGNLSYSPGADSISCLLALDAEVCVQRGAAATNMSVEDFVAERARGAARDAIVTEVRLPERAPDTAAVFQRFTLTAADPKALFTVTVARRRTASTGTWTRVRIAVGGSVGPGRVHAAERLLDGEAPTPARLGEAAALMANAFPPPSDHRASSSYRRRVIEVVGRRALEELTRSGA